MTCFDQISNHYSTGLTGLMLSRPCFQSDCINYQDFMIRLAAIFAWVCKQSWCLFVLLSKFWSNYWLKELLSLPFHTLCLCGRSVHEDSSVTDWLLVAKAVLSLFNPVYVYNVSFNRNFSGSLVIRRWPCWSNAFKEFWIHWGDCRADRYSWACWRQFISVHAVAEGR